MPFKPTPDTLFASLDRVPLLVAGPDCARGAECSQPVSLIDLFPTINEWHNLAGDPGYAEVNTAMHKELEAQTHRAG